VFHQEFGRLGTTSMIRAKPGNDAAARCFSVRRCSFGLQKHSRAVQFERLKAEKKIPEKS
jgi:hypothetical protein